MGGDPWVALVASWWCMTMCRASCSGDPWVALVDASPEGWRTFLQTRRAPKSNSPYWHILHPDTPLFGRINPRITGEGRVIRPNSRAWFERFIGNSNCSRPCFVHRQCIHLFL